MATFEVYDFLSSKQNIQKALSGAGSLIKGDPKNVATQLKSALDRTKGSVTERCLCLDLVLREAARDAIVEEDRMEDVLALLELVLLLTDQELCSIQTVFSVLLDLADLASVSQCEQLFTFVESKTSTWKSEALFAKGKNHLLRMCNDILKKLSKSQDTVFCGRIQLFLARLFPLTEKSGLNLFGEFNYDNLTIFSDVAPAADTVELPPGAGGDKMEVDQAKPDLPGDSPIDYTFYTKFWSLQDFFRDPTQCYSKPGWKKFSSYLDTVLDAFSTMKLENSKLKKRKRTLEKMADKAGHADITLRHNFFAKYLTSVELFNLQLSDSSFRRYLLVQVLVLFHYLRADVKYKTKQMDVTDEGKVWMKKTENAVYNIIKETPPSGDLFAVTIKMLLEQEDQWNTWKNAGCPNFVRQPDPTDTAKRIIVRKRSMVDDLNLTNQKRHNLGNEELNRLWNLYPDNEGICKSEARQFTPALESFFEDAIMSADPANQIEETYKEVNKPGWQWRALRLLSRKSRFLFEQTQNPARPISQYLEDLLRKYSKEIMPSSEAADAANNPNDELEMNLRPNTQDDNADDDIDESVLDDEPTETEASTEKKLSPREVENDEEGEVTEVTSASYVTSEHITLIADLIKAEWKTLAQKLDGVDEDDFAYFEEKESAQAQANNMLTVWKEGARDKGTVGAMYKSLTAIGKNDVAVRVFGKIDV